MSSDYEDTVDISSREELGTEVVHTDMIVVSTSNEATVTKADAVDGCRMALVSFLAGGDSRIPDLDHSIQATRCNS